MKKVILFIIICAIADMAYAQQTDTTVVFQKLVHDFGAIAKSGGPQTFSFEFTNKGTNPAVIQKVTSSCGCTVADWTKAPVAPGEKGFVKVTYSPSGTTAFNKAVTVNFAGGTPETLVLRIHGNVTAPPEN